VQPGAAQPAAGVNATRQQHSAPGQDAPGQASDAARQEAAATGVVNSAFPAVGPAGVGAVPPASRFGAGNFRLKPPQEFSGADSDPHVREWPDIVMAFLIAIQVPIGQWSYPVAQRCSAGVACVHKGLTW